MEDFKKFQDTMKSLFAGKETAIQTGLKVEYFQFESSYKIKGDKPGLMKGDLFFHELVDADYSSNYKFSYPVVAPAENRKWDRCILLFHGLNEKSWDKYLAWAGKLSLQMNKPVILFPIAYHMNRAPKSWSDPRMMKGAVQSRLSFHKKNESTFANAALSTRLGAYPETFIYSGLQSYYDIWQLLADINSGNHPIFEANCKADIFAYSIGAFLAEILFIGNPDKLLQDSRLFLFAGGPTFDSMIGNSRYIMDYKAFHSLLTLKRNKKRKMVYESLVATNLPDFENAWNGFMAMIAFKKGKEMREKALMQRGTQIYAVALEKDKVMPVKQIVKSLRGKKDNLPVTIDIIDFPYDYTHENPFPLKNDKILPLVNRSFEVIIEKAVRFYKKPVTKPNDLEHRETIGSSKQV